MTTQRQRVLVGLTCLGAAAFAQAFAAVWVAKNRGVGHGDLSAYAYWNLLFAIYLYATVRVLRPRFQIARLGVRLLAWTFTGSTAGFLWTWIVAAVLGPWIMTFSFPVLYIWTATGALAGAAIGWRTVPDAIARRGRPWLVLLVPPLALLTVVVLNVLLLLGSRYVWNRAEPEVFTFPDGFVGQVYVIYDSTAGRPPHARGDTRRYDLPASGLLVTRDDPVQGWLDEHFCYRRTDGSQAEIRATWNSTIQDTEENRADTTVGVYFRTFGQRTEGGCTLTYTSFFVGRKVDVLEERGVDDLESYVDSCVQKTRSPRDGSIGAPGGSDTLATRSRGLAPFVLLSVATCGLFRPR